MIYGIGTDLCDLRRLRATFERLIDAWKEARS